nr:MAG TPA_asm: tail protein [Caudoviricetes sp.]
MANQPKYVTSAKPKVGGSIYSAPIGTALPTDATTALNTAFKCLGYVSDDGVQNSDDRKTTDIKSWGGDIVNSVQTEKTDTFKYTLIEALNVDVLKEIYGDSNVTGDLDTGITVKSNSTELDEHVIVIEMVLRNNVLKRVVLPSAKVTDVGEIKYKDGDNVGYETTVTCFPDDNSNTHYEYIVKPKTAVSRGDR